MRFQRSSGVLLHPTSLPGPYGAGDLGPEASAFIEFLAAAGQRIWQVLPLNPTGYADSPYQCFSAFAGNPLLISLDLLVKQGLLSPQRSERRSEVLHNIDRLWRGNQIPLCQAAAGGGAFLCRIGQRAQGGVREFLLQASGVA